jgi:hypothetical protein
MAAIRLSPYGTRAKPIQIGDRFGRWIVVAEGKPTTNGAGHRQRRVRCRCDCGVETDKLPSGLRNGSSRSCGCLQREITAKRSTTHGHTRGYQKHHLYDTWVKMRSRCRNPNDQCFEHYGGRGIDVCDRWFDDFAAFASDMGMKPSPHHSVERVDNDGGYNPSNCIWADKTAQARNTRRNRWIDVRGDQVLIAEIAERAGICESSVRGRLRRGWRADDMDTPLLPAAERARRASLARWGEKA